MARMGTTVPGVTPRETCGDSISSVRFANSSPFATTCILIKQSSQMPTLRTARPRSFLFKPPSLTGKSSRPKLSPIHKASSNRTPLHRRSRAIPSPLPILSYPLPSRTATSARWSCESGQKMAEKGRLAQRQETVSVLTSRLERQTSRLFNTPPEQYLSHAMRKDHLPSRLLFCMNPP
jgi:hypothetical protein